MLTLACLYPDAQPGLLPKLEGSLELSPPALRLAQLHQKYIHPDTSICGSALSYEHNSADYWLNKRLHVFLICSCVI